MKSVWAALVGLLVAPLAGCGLQEHPRSAPRPVSNGGEPIGGADAAVEPPAPDAGKVQPQGGASGEAGTMTTGPEAGARPADGPAPPVTGPGVMIGGTMVARENVIVVLHLGHSNMAGRALGPPELKPYFYDTDPHLWQYQKGGVWKPAKEPLCPDGGTPGHPQGAGPGMALLRRALMAAPDKYIVSIGRGQSLDFDASCFTFRKGGIYYDDVVIPAMELKGKVTFAGVFTMLGYDGRSDPRAKSPGYIDCLAGLAADLRTALEMPDLPFIAGDYERGATGTWSPTCCGAPQVIAQLALVPMRIPRSFLIPSDGIPMQDDHHYNMTGHQIWADRAFKGMAAGGLLPWATAP